MKYLHHWYFEIQYDNKKAWEIEEKYYTYSCFDSRLCQDTRIDKQ